MNIENLEDLNKLEKVFATRAVRILESRIEEIDRL
jgi:hypothetical protein